MERTVRNTTIGPANLVALEPNPVYVLMTLITYLKWTSVCVIYDYGTDKQALDLVNELSKRDIFVVMLNVSEVTSSHIDALASTKHKNTPDELKFAFLCSQRQYACKSFLEKPFDHDRKHIWRNSLLHFSRWIVSVPDQDNLLTLHRNSSILFDNVAVIHREDLTSKTSVLNNKPERTIISSLQWNVGRQRRLSPVGIVGRNGATRIDSDIFPNTKHGFNGRKFIIGTLPWPPFTIRNDKTKQYTGFMIDMLRVISRELNFSYQLQDSADGKWGAVDNEETNTWNGMIGELQRRDLDLVFAPITINPHRETVMDFTHPFYYEFSAILLKKPSINDSRWTTLINIFRPKVLMFTGLSLFVMSILLCVFEKYSPYYRKVKRTNGLHHFTDSFWYMYGALLTQGGAHMAEAFSGRTVVTSWWLFCIILAAAYSGNFVAYLTVSKERLPFSNIEELIEQDDYKWGTLGSSIYETILKTSDLPERIEFWNKIVEFNKTDHSVLSDNLNDQVKKVLNSRHYACIADKTGFDQAKLSNCELTTAASDLLPLQYGLGLPNHSPFGQLFSDEIVVILESGLIPMWKKRYLPKSAKCQFTHGAHRVTIFDIQVAFYLIGIGIGLALILLWYECVRRKLQRCRCHRQERKCRQKDMSAVSVINVTYDMHKRPQKVQTETGKKENVNTKEYFSFDTPHVSLVTQAINRQVRTSFRGSYRETDS